MRTPNHPFDVEDCLCAIGQAADDLTPFSTDWQPARSAGEAVQFAAFLDSPFVGGGWQRIGRRWRLTDAWWGGRPAQCEQAETWVLSDDRMTELEAAFFAFGADEGTASRLPDAAGTLAVLRASAGPA